MKSFVCILLSASLTTSPLWAASLTGAQSNSPIANIPVEDGQNQPAAPSYQDLERMAEGAMADELSVFNMQLAAGNFDIAGYVPNGSDKNTRNYNKSEVEFLVQSMGKTQIDPSYLFNKCIMSDASVLAIESTHLTSANDTVTQALSVLDSVRAEYDKNMWKLTSDLCENSMARFKDRLKQATVQTAGATTPVNFGDDEISAYANIVFAPFNYGKPTFGKAFEKAIGIVFTTGFLAGAVLSLYGAAAAGIVISGASLGSNAVGLENSLPQAQNALAQLNFKLLLNQQTMNLVLTNEEMALTLL